MDRDTLAGLERHINAERIASVIAHPYAHSFNKHRDEFGGDIEAFKQAIIDTLTDPETLVTKDKKGYVFYNRKGSRPEDNVIVLIDPESPDWGSAFKPNKDDGIKFDKDKGMKFLRDLGVPINQNGDVTYLNKMHAGFFADQRLFVKVREPLRLNGLTREQTAEVALSMFDRADSSLGNSLRSSFDLARSGFMRDMKGNMAALSPEQKETLRECAHRYKETTREEYASLKRVDAGLLPKGKQADALAAILRDPEQGAAYTAGLEEKFAMAQTPEEEKKLLEAIDACEMFGRYDAVRRDALNQTIEILDLSGPRLSSTFNKSSAPVANKSQERVLERLRV